MAPKGKKTKAEEALDFLSNLDNLDVEPAPPAAEAAPPAPLSAATESSTSSAPRASTDSSRKLEASTELAPPGPPSAPEPQEDEEATKALAFLEAQINTKRAPLSAPRAAAPAPAPAPAPPASALAPNDDPNVPSQGTPSAGWLSPSSFSFWSTASSAIQSAQKMADQGYKKVRAEGVGGVTQGLEGLGVRGLDLEGLRKGAEERLAGIAKGVDLEKLRNDLVSTTTSTLTTILNTVAPPISAHETLELWLSHPMVGYAGVEGVIYRAWTRILEQTESGELVVVWSPPEGVAEDKRGMYPVTGWDEGWKRAEAEVAAMRAREEKQPQGRAKENPNIPVTTIPIFLHLQPVLAPLSIPEPPVVISSTSSNPPTHLQFIISLLDPKHSLRFTTVSQPAPADWLEVEYERSDWVEERLVDVLRVGVEVLAQDVSGRVVKLTQYVATRMGLKQRVAIFEATPEVDANEAKV